MKQIIAVVLVTVAGMTTMSCATPTRQYLYDRGDESSKKIADVLGKWQSKTLDDAMHYATQGRQAWTEQKDAYIVQKTVEGKINEPIVVRSIAWFNNVIASIDADIVLIEGLQAQAESVGK